MSTIEKKIIQKKLDKFWLWFVNVVSFFFVLVHRLIPNWPWRLQGQRYPIFVELLPRVPDFSLFRPMTLSFPGNWGLRSLHRLQWWFWNFREKIVKNRKHKMSNIPKVVLWGPLRRKFRKSLKTFGYHLHEEYNFEIFTATASHVNEKEKKC